jgi:multiple sugar transport system substrate-binding protein
MLALPKCHSVSGVVSGPCCVTISVTTAERSCRLIPGSFLAPGYYQTFTWYPFMWQGGGDIATKDGKRSAFGSAGTIQALKFWQDAIQQNVAPRNFLGGGAWDVVANLASGYCAMQNLGVWGVAALRENAKDFEYGVFPLPLPPNGQAKTIFGGWAFVANAKGKNPEEAAKFCVWALGSMQEDSIQRVVDWCTKAKSDVSPRKSALEKATAEGGYSSAAMKLFKDEIFPTGRGEPRVPPEVYKAVSDAIQACELGGADPRRRPSELKVSSPDIPAHHCANRYSAEKIAHA